MKKWWYSRSETFTKLCGAEGDTFTHGNVVMMHIYLLAVFVAMLAAGAIE